MPSDNLVFVSYSRINSEFVLKLINDLDKDGVPSWLDQRDIPAGSQWDTAVGKALEKASHLLLVLSQASVKSENVLDEVVFFKGSKKTILPILIEECEIPFNIQRIQYIDFRADYQSSLTKLLNILPRAEITNDYIIKINQIPEAQFDFSTGFGWAYQVRTAETNILIFRILIKSFTGERTNENLALVRKLGEEQVQSFLERSDFEQREYCYQWEPNYSDITEVECKKISPPQYRSPLR